MSDPLRRACLRSVAAVDLRLRRGLSSVGTIASIAPLLGFLGTVLNIPACFPGFDTERSTVMAYEIGALASSLAISAAGVAVGVAAYWIHSYLRARADALRDEAVQFCEGL